MKTSLPRRRRGGFTLIEVLLVLVILVILGSLAVTAYGPIRNQACVRATQAQLGLLKTPLNLYKQNLGAYPDLLEYLWACPPSVNYIDWQGPYIDQEILDGWGRYFDYAIYDNGYTCVVTSRGADNISGNDDDIGQQFSN